MNVFYNQNIIITNKYKQIQSTVKSFDDLFSTDFKQITIVADAGYGKSTFVHEMVRQWIEGENVFAKEFTFLFLFRLTEVRHDETKSLENFLKMCLSPKDTSIISSLMKDSK